VGAKKERKQKKKERKCEGGRTGNHIQVVVRNRQFTHYMMIITGPLAANFGNKNRPIRHPKTNKLKKKIIQQSSQIFSQSAKPV
jgi:nitrate reductase alpha subunit